jgi:hypothetical protein
MIFWLITKHLLQTKYNLNLFAECLQQIGLLNQQNKEVLRVSLVITWDIF